METLDFPIVALLIAGALLYLYRVFKPKHKSSCGCGSKAGACRLRKQP